MAAATKTDEWVVCVMAHCNPATPGVVEQGQEFRADNPIVAAAPNLFMPKGTPANYWPTEVDYAVATNEANAREAEGERKAAFDRAAKANTVTIEAPKLVKAKKDVVGELDGQPATVKKGSHLPDDHPFVVEHREDFTA